MADSFRSAVNMSKQLEVTSSAYEHLFRRFQRWLLGQRVPFLSIYDTPTLGVKPGSDVIEDSSDTFYKTLNLFMCEQC